MALMRQNLPGLVSVRAVDCVIAAVVSTRLMLNEGFVPQRRKGAKREVLGLNFFLTS
jgi:hypothetical protein